MLEDSLNVTDFLNSLNITSSMKRNTNGGDDDDDDDELINTIIQQIEQKEKQRQDKEVAMEDANKRANTVTFEANTKHTDTVVVCNNTSSNDSKTNGKQKSKHSGRRGGKRQPRYQPLVSRIDPVANHHKEPANIGIADADANDHTHRCLLRSNPDLSRPNEVNYLFRLPLDNPNPAPILIVKK